MKLSSIKVNSARVEEGQWVKDIPGMEDLELKVRGSNCAAANALRHKLVRSLPAKDRNNPNGIPLEAMTSITAKVNLEVILLDWRNVDEGPFSKEKAQEFLSNPDYIDFQEAVNWAASQVGRQETEARDAQLGNSPAASAGS